MYNTFRVDKVVTKKELCKLLYGGQFIKYSSVQISSKLQKVQIPSVSDSSPKRSVSRRGASLLNLLRGHGIGEKF